MEQDFFADGDFEAYPGDVLDFSAWLTHDIAPVGLFSGLPFKPPGVEHTQLVPEAPSVPQPDLSYSQLGHYQNSGRRTTNSRSMNKKRQLQELETEIAMLRAENLQLKQEKLQDAARYARLDEAVRSGDVAAIKEECGQCKIRDSQSSDAQTPREPDRTLSMQQMWADLFSKDVNLLSTVALAERQRKRTSSDDDLRATLEELSLGSPRVSETTTDVVGDSFHVLLANRESMVRIAHNSPGSDLIVPFSIGGQLKSLLLTWNALRELGLEEAQLRAVQGLFANHDRNMVSVLSMRTKLNAELSQLLHDNLPTFLQYKNRCMLNSPAAREEPGIKALFAHLDRLKENMEQEKQLEVEHVNALSVVLTPAQSAMLQLRERNNQKIDDMVARLLWNRPDLLVAYLPREEVEVLASFRNMHPE